MIGLGDFSAFVGEFACDAPEHIHTVAATKSECIAVVAVFRFFTVEAKVGVFHVVTIVAVFAIFVVAVF